MKMIGRNALEDSGLMILAKMEAEIDAMKKPEDVQTDQTNQAFATSFQKMNDRLAARQEIDAAEDLTLVGRSKVSRSTIELSCNPEAGRIMVRIINPELLEVEEGVLTPACTMTFDQAMEIAASIASIVQEECGEE